VGLLADLAWLGPLYALALLGAAALARRTSERRAWVLGAGTILLVSASMWLVSVGATEFRLQRGAYPSFAEAFEGLRDPTFVRGSIGILFFERYSSTSIVAAAVTAILIVVHERTRSPSFSWRALGAFAAVGVATAGLLFAVRASSEPPVPPMIRLVADVFVSAPTRHESGLRSVLESTRFDEKEVASGLGRYGLDPEAARKLLGPAVGPCRQHPLSRPLPGSRDGLEEGSELARALVDVSEALFHEADEPLVVWHVALESFRADDVHALHTAAPQAIAPFVNGVYEGADGDVTIAFPRAYQAGVRTAQAISALVCGFGALPFQLALARDLPDVPLRCTPDVLHDAGFATRLYYGSDASFENMRGFAEAHGMEVTDQPTLPKDLPRGAWRAATDAALFAAAARASRAGPALQYNFLLTMSGHSPFDLPDDVPPGLVARIDEVLRGHPTAKAEDRRRLATMAYTDETLGKTIAAAASAPETSRSVFVVTADHATSDPFLWDPPRPEAQAAVPMFVRLPNVMLTAQAREKVRALKLVAARTPVSLDDVPSMLLALLSRHPALRNLPKDRRWHTVPESPAAWGIDASSRVFTVGHAPPFSFVPTTERSVPYSVWNEPLGPILRDATAALSAILVGTRSCAPTNAISSDRAPAR
jgi:hypothetical protein